MEITKTQSLSLFILRIFIGWHLLHEGLVKIINPDWTSFGYLKESKGIFSKFFLMISENYTILNVVDFTNKWGLTIIGLGLLLGLFTRFIAFSGMVLLLIYYMCAPPLANLEYSMPTEGNYLIVNKNLIESAALFVLAVFDAGRHYGIDLILNEKNGVINLLKGSK